MQSYLSSRVPTVLGSLGALLLVACGASDPNTDGTSSSGGTSATSGGNGGTQASGGSNAQSGGRAGNSSSGGTSGGSTADGGTTSGGTSNGGGASSGGTASGGTASGGTGVFTPPECAEGSSTELPENAPELEPGVWTHINPESVSFAPGDAPFTQGMAMDPCNPATLYLCVAAVDKVNNPVGLYRTTDAGTSWLEIGDLQSPIRVRVDPADPLHLYAVDGVAGNTKGFWVSTDGGETFYRPQSFQDLGNTDLTWDAYSVEADPADFNHVLVTFHSAWQAAQYNGSSGVIESTDGGDSWTVHPTKSTWYTGHDVYFLYDPEKGIGNKDTWLLGTQGDGHWRTTDAGETWTKVTDVNMDHGGGTTYYTAEGVLYVSGSPQIIRSTDNGETFAKVGPSDDYYLSVIGDGNFLYTHSHHNSGVFKRALESDDTNWTSLPGNQSLNSGPFELALDAQNRILYSANLGEGIIALKLDE